MANVNHPHDHDVPVVEPNQHDDVPIIPEPVLEDKDGDPEEDEFEEEEDPQEEDDMEINIEEDENEPELTYLYEEWILLILHRLLLSESSTVAIPQKDGDRLLPGFIRRDIDSLFGRMVNFSRRLCGREMAHALVEKKGKAKDKFYGKLILDLGNEVRSSVEQGTAAMEKLVKKLGNNERVERDLYWTRVRAHEFYQEMIHKGFVFEERPNKAIDVPIEDEKSPLSKPIMPPKSTPITQAAIHQMINESVNAAISAERARQANVRNDASGSGPVREGKKVKFVAATLKGPSLTWWKTKVATIGLETVNQIPWTEMKQLMTTEFCQIKEIQRMEHKLWNLKVKEYDIVAYTQRFNELALMFQEW
ncbi:putative reverse transcriptase domain-containing protein [Tanacetum coccineum]